MSVLVYSSKYVLWWGGIALQIDCVGTRTCPPPPGDCDGCYCAVGFGLKTHPPWHWQTKASSFSNFLWSESGNFLEGVN